MAIGIAFEEGKKGCVWRREVWVWVGGNESKITEEEEVKFIVKLYKNSHYF